MPNICPKCNGHKFHSDKHCSSCYEFSVPINRGKKSAMQAIISELGYKVKGAMEKDTRGEKYSRYVLIVEAPKSDEKTIKELLAKEA